MVFIAAQTGTKMNKAITIREANKGDLSTLLQFEQGIIMAERPFDPTIRPDPVHYYDMGQLLESKDALVVVAEDAEKLVASGYVTVKEARHYLDHGSYAYMGFMYTHPEYRGQGINSGIIDVLRQWAISRGLTEIRLTVYNENSPAISAYERYGFKKHLIEMRLPNE